MRLQIKLALIFAVVVVITFGTSFFGYLQVKNLGSALYEIGVVRLPSIEGLNMIQDARTTLGESELTGYG